MVHSILRNSVRRGDVTRALSSVSSRFDTATRPTSRLRELFFSDEPTFVMEAHNGLSARIVEETGFDAIWGSGLSISASLGLRDENEASWTQVLDVVETMADSASIPVLVDGDTGYGNFNNCIRLIQKLESRGVAGVAIEDKLFPKRNSFIHDTKRQELCPVEEFCGKIKAMKDHQMDPDFVVVARCEGLILNQGLEETLRRCELYANSGADAILVHSKNNDGVEVKEFLDNWSLKHVPIVLVPTMYPTISASTWAEAGATNLIWANHNLRASTRAMQQISQDIFEAKSIADVDSRITSVSEIFRLQRMDELKQKEKLYESYLPTAQQGADMDNTAAMQDSASSVSEPVSKVEPKLVYDTLANHGVSFYTGVPDSLLKSFCKYVQDNTDISNHVIAANEGASVAIASGYHLGTGNVPLIYLQNSGLGNAVNPLTSLANEKVYSIPMVVMIGWRGEPGVKDEPQHVEMGLKTINMLRSLGIPYKVLDGARQEEIIAETVANAKASSSPQAILVRKGTFFEDKSSETPTSNFVSQFSRQDVLKAITEVFPSSTPFVSTTGYTSRELYSIRKENYEASPDTVSLLGQDFYTVGSMGHCAGIACGLALSQPGRDVLCIDGDGAALMHLGNMATIGQHAPHLTNFKHVIINNGLHESVGGQPTAGTVTDFREVAMSCRYHHAEHVPHDADLETLVNKLKELSDRKGPSLLQVDVHPGTLDGLLRPESTPLQNKLAFMEHVASERST